MTNIKRSMITLKDVSRTFYGKTGVNKVLHRISLEIPEGAVTGIIGSSGAGKSTLLRTINLLEQPDEGSVTVNGRELTALSRRELAAERKKIGMIFQHFNLLSSRTVYENVALPLELTRTGRDVIRQKVTELLALVGLESKAGEYPANLSGGQRQRVAIARALVNEPHLLLCDEATSALDPFTTRSVLQLLKDLHRRLNLTIVLVTHEMEVVKAVCSHVVCMDSGRIAAFSTTEAWSGQRDITVFEEFLKSEQ